ncbi:hypothetical protein [Martelella radicis]|uniref:Uncharacterized protein n=1 Tax=Martelella radicis TaxID=1397476 RepID=A0A7W6KNL3_9HYPH|nr:hypothetical protein [Martelella radicis]MBB4124547.1 hypothetical protein [Martelella radicis]
MTVMVHGAFLDAGIDPADIARHSAGRHAAIHDHDDPVGSAQRLTETMDRDGNDPPQFAAKAMHQSVGMLLPFRPAS